MHSYDYTKKVREKLTNYCNRKTIKYETLKTLWFDVFSSYLKYWKWNTSSIERLFSFGKWGHNWEALHFPDKHGTLKDMIEDFINELDYCSDRMSLDRLLRTHWLFNFLCCSYFNKQTFQ